MLQSRSSFRALANPQCTKTTTFQFQEVRLKEFGSSLVAPERRSPEYLQKVIQSEIERWAALIKAAKIRLNESDRINLGGR